MVNFSCILLDTQESGFFMPSIGLTFRNNFLKFFEASRYTSFRALSLNSGVSPSRAQKISTGLFDDSSVGPGIFLVDKLCRELNCTPNDLLGYADSGQNSGASEPARTGQPSVEILVQRWVRSGGKVDGFKDFLRYCQIYGEPKDGKIKLLNSGALSLASRAAKTTSVPYLQDQFFKFPANTQSSIYEGQKRAWDRGMGLDAEFVNHQMPEKDRKAKFDFLRAAVRTKMADGSEALVVYCAVIGQ